jgi:hypothetical protein
VIPGRLDARSVALLCALRLSSTTMWTGRGVVTRTRFTTVSKTSRLTALRTSRLPPRPCTVKVASQEMAACRLRAKGLQSRGRARFIKKDQPRRIDGCHGHVARATGSRSAAIKLFFQPQTQLGQEPTQMRGAEGNASGGLQPSAMLRQGGIGVDQHPRTHLRVAGRIEFRLPPGARLLGQLLAPAMPCQPPKHGASIDTNSRAASPRASPASKAATKRSRKSADRRRAMPHPDTGAALSHAALMRTMACITLTHLVGLIQDEDRRCGAYASPTALHKRRVRDRQPDSVSPRYC